MRKAEIRPTQTRVVGNVLSNFDEIMEENEFENYHILNSINGTMEWQGKTKTVRRLESNEENLILKVAVTKTVINPSGSSDTENNYSRITVKCQDEEENPIGGHTVYIYEKNVLLATLTTATSGTNHGKRSWDYRTDVSGTHTLRITTKKENGFNPATSYKTITVREPVYISILPTMITLEHGEEQLVTVQANNAEGRPIVDKEITLYEGIRELTTETTNDDGIFTYLYSESENRGKHTKITTNSSSWYRGETSTITGVLSTRDGTPLIPSLEFKESSDWLITVPSKSENKAQTDPSLDSNNLYVLGQRKDHTFTNYPLNLEEEEYFLRFSTIGAYDYITVAKINNETPVYNEGWLFTANKAGLSGTQSNIVFRIYAENGEVYCKTNDVSQKISNYSSSNQYYINIYPTTTTATLRAIEVENKEGKRLTDKRVELIEANKSQTVASTITNYFGQFTLHYIPTLTTSNYYLVFYSTVEDTTNNEYQEYEPCLNDLGKLTATIPRINMTWLLNKTSDTILNIEDEYPTITGGNSKLQLFQEKDYYLDGTKKTTTPITILSENYNASTNKKHLQFALGINSLDVDNIDIIVTKQINNGTEEDISSELFNNGIDRFHPYYLEHELPSNTSGTVLFNFYLTGTQGIFQEDPTKGYGLKFTLKLEYKTS